MKERDAKAVADRLMQEALEAVEKHEKAEAVEFPVSEDQQIVVSSETAIDLEKYIEKEMYLRLFADFENFRKRAQKDKEAADISGREKILKGFLEILDSFDRGFSNLKDDSSPLADGVRMILSQAEHWLRTEGLERIATTGQVFDPSQHEAVSMVTDEFVESGKIIQELRRGYRWHKRLLRAASVVVSKGPTITEPVISENVEE